MAPAPEGAIGLTVVVCGGRVLCTFGVIHYITHTLFIVSLCAICSLFPVSRIYFPAI
jgi:hypothetical protein